MANAKIIKLLKFLLILIFIFFPFGQLLKYSIGNINFGILDALVLAVVLTSFFTKLKAPNFSQYFLSFIYWTIFSFFISINIIGVGSSILGALYLLRLICYFVFFITIYNFSQKELKAKNAWFTKTSIIDLLIIVSTFIGLFGWIQYIYFPDLRTLAVLGWDDHLSRLTGTFLDPGFTGVLLGLGGLTSIFKYRETKRKIYLALFCFLVVTLLFTYSRTSYIAFLGGSGVFLVLLRKLKYLLLVSALFLFGGVLLPRPGGEGVRLERTYSIQYRIESIKSGLEIWRSSPLIGVGYNNICWAKRNLLGEKPGNYKSNSCSGIDSSLIQILAATGLTGFMLFIYSFYKLIEETWLSKDKLTILVLSSLAMVLIHSLFVNSLLYPWVFIYLSLLFSAVSFKESKKQ